MFCTIVNIIIWVLITAGLTRLIIKYQRWSKVGVPKKRNLYSQGGEWFFLKRIAMYCVLQLRQFKKNRQKGKKNGIYYDHEVAKRYRDSEKPQQLNESPYGIDSVYFYGSNGKGLSFILRFARRHHRKGELWFLLRLPDNRHFEHLGCPDTRVSNCHPTNFQVDGLRIFCEEPMRRWRVIYCGFMKESGKSNSFVQISLDACFRAYTNPFDVEHDLSNHLVAEGVAREPWSTEFFDRLQREHDDQTHLEQWGSFSGSVKVDEQNFPLNLQGYRDHSYGTRNWEQYYRYAAHFAHFEDGSSMSLGSVCLPKTTTQVRYGYLFTSYGAKWPITSHNFNLWEHGESIMPENTYKVKFTANGKKFVLRMEVDRNFTFYVGEESTSMIIERFANYTLNDVKGHGVSEYCYRNFSSPKFARQESLLHLCDKVLQSQDPRPLTIPFNEALCSASALTGGKGSQLGLLMSVDSVKVPKGFAVTTEAYKTLFEKNDSLKLAIKHLEVASVDTTSEEFVNAQKNIQNLFTAELLSEAIREAIRTTGIQVFGEEEFVKLRFAVRSSAVGEDAEDASGAGQMDTFLGVTNSELMEKIAKCWASQFSTTALSYRIKLGRPVDTKMAVVVQQMVDADAAGVLFTQHPRTCSANHLVIESNFGLGESVVSGECTPDSFEVTRFTDENMVISTRTIGSKETKFTMVESGGAEFVKESTDERKQASLTDDQILRLAHIGRLLEKHFGNARDIEWAVKGDEVFILQARAITTMDMLNEDLVHEFDSGLPHDLEYLTTANIGEMMPGAVTPLTGTVFGRAVDFALQDGIICTYLMSEYCNGQRLVPQFNNHLFININTMANLTELHASASELKMMFLAILGRVLERPTVKELEFYNGRSPMLIRMRNFFINMFISYRSTKKTRQWEKKLSQGFNIRKCYTAEDQLDAIDTKLDDYYGCWSDTVKNSGNSAIGSMAVLSLIADGSEWNNELYSKVAAILSTCDNVYSAEVPAAMRRLACIIANSDSKDAFLKMDAKTASKWLLTTRDVCGKEFRAFIYKHGHRCIREAELREIPWNQQPEKVLDVVRSIIENGAYQETDKRELEEHELIDMLPANLNILKKWILRRVIKMARRGVGLREWGKSISIELSDVFKKAFQHLGKLLAAEGTIPDADLVYFFSYDELHFLVKDRCSKLVAKACRRRNTLPKQMSFEFPEIAQGIPVPESAAEESTSFSDGLENGLTLSGMPVSRGEIDGRARVVKSLTDASKIKKGEILIVPYTDVGWSPYFPLIAGLVTEKGGLLSHGAVVAREYGLPCIVSCKQATSVFSSGDLVRLNGTRGTLQRMSE